MPEAHASHDMIFRETGIEGVWVVEPERHADERGFFARTWDGAELAERGLNGNLSQCSISYNHRRGTLRGMHYQEAPHEEAKLVRCTAGAIFDVAVDLRPDSPTFTKWVGHELAAENRLALYVPEGCAHGFITLADGAEVAYQISERYAPEAARGVRWDDPAFAIDWPVEVNVISERDRSYPDFVPTQRLGMSATAVPATGAGERMYDLATRLFPMCRSITGAGVRDTLQEVARLIPLEVTEVPSGTPVLDWTIPDEWNIRDAYVARADGTRVVDFRQSNLHVVSYSEPVRATMSLDELRPHLHVHGENPDWVPYRTSYYERTWGFCLSARTLEALDDGPYEVVVDSTLAPGSLSYGECFLPGERAGRGPAQHARMPPLARERQRLRHRAPDRAGGRARESAADALVSHPVRSRHDRLDCVARA